MTDLPVKTRARIISWIRGHPNLMAGLFGIVVSILMASAFEGIFWKLNQLKHSREVMVYTDSAVYYEADPLLARRALPNVRVTQRKTCNNVLSFESTYTFDGYGRRVTPHPSDVRLANHFAIFFGCSFTFGTGVEDDQTLPAYVTKQAAGWQAYNYGFQGYGPSQCLGILETHNVRAQVPETDGIGIYVFIPDHVRRVIGAKKVVSRWGAGKDYPCYELDASGEVVYRGSFRQAHPWRLWFYDQMDKEPCMNFFDVEMPFRVSPAHLRLTAAVLAAAQSNFLRQFPGSRFYVLLYPEHVKASMRAFPAAQMVPYLKEAGLSVLDYSAALDLSQPGMLIENDGHPMARAHELLAQHLVQDLKLNNADLPTP